jgi:hypothetical protein
MVMKMKNYALIENGLVTNVVLWDGANEWQADGGVSIRLIGEGEVVAIGYSFDGQTFAAPPAPPTPPAPPPSMPSQVTMRQARLALLAVGKLASVDSAISALPSPQRDAAQIEWEFASTVDRGSSFVVQLSRLLDLDDAALDALFMAAASL